MWFKKAVNSKFVKCFLIAIVLVFSYQVNKPKAFAPLAFAVPLLAGLAVEQMASMGIKWATKEIAQKKADDFAKAWAANPANKFDFMGQNPYLNKDGSVYITPSAMDRAKIASLIAGGLGGVAVDQLLKEKPDSVVTPLSGGGSHTMTYTDDSYGRCAFNFVREFGSTIRIVPIGLEQIALEMKFKPNGQYLAGSSTAYPNQQLFTTISGTAEYFNFTGFLGRDSSVGTTIYNAYKKALQVCATQNGIYEKDGLMIPTTINNVYNINPETTNNYQLPNQAELQNKPYIIKNIMPPSQNEGEITWEQVINNNGDETTTTQKVIDGSAYYLANGDWNTTNYDITVVNNYYTDVNYDKKKAEVEQELNAPPVENLPAEPVSDLDPSMWQVMKNTYNYLDDGIDASLASMKGITDSAQGITTYLNQTMGWLPMEFRAVLTSAFVLGVFAHFLRR